MSQSSAILAHLEAGYTLTPADAYERFGTLALHSRIAELRGQGYRIDKTMRHENGKSFGEYFIAIPH